MNKKGTISLYITFIIVTLIIIVMTAVIAPFGVQVSSELYLMGQDIIEDSNSTISAIHNDTIRTKLQGLFNQASNAQADNIEMSANLYQYSWIFLIIITALVIFLFSRRMVEYTNGGFI